MIEKLLPLLGVVIGAILGSVLTWLTQRSEWGRQRRWELRRDATLDSVRGLADLEDAVTSLDSAFTQPRGTLTEEARAVQQNLQLDAMLQFRKRCSEYKRAHITADLAVGGNLSRKLSKYFQFALPLVRQGYENRRAFLEGSDTKKGLALRSNEVIMSAREALGIKDAGDLPLPDE